MPAAEHIFAEKLEGMKTFDSFMDYNVGFWAPGGLDRWVKTFEAASQSYLALTWTADGLDG